MMSFLARLEMEVPREHNTLFAGAQSTAGAPGALRGVNPSLLLRPATQGRGVGLARVKPRNRISISYMQVRFEPHVTARINRLDTCANSLTFPRLT